jgi:hypothetical protein
MACGSPTRSGSRTVSSRVKRQHRTFAKLEVIDNAIIGAVLPQAQPCSERVTVANSGGGDRGRF